MGIIFEKIKPCRSFCGALFKHRFGDESKVWFECMNNQIGIFDCESGMVESETIYKNSFENNLNYCVSLDPSPFFPAVCHLLGENLVISEYQSSDRKVLLTPRFRTSIQDFDFTNNYLKTCVLTGSAEQGLEIGVVLLGSDGSLNFKTTEKV